MSRVRDQVRILGRTANSNPDELRLVTEADLITETRGTTHRALSYDTVNEMVVASVDSGQRAFVNETNRMYMYNGTGWYNIALVNTGFTISINDSSFALDSDNPSIQLIGSAQDPEEVPITYSLTFNPSNITDSAISFTIDSSVATISNLDSAVGVKTFTAIMSASDGINIASANATITQTISTIDSLGVSAISVDEGSSVTFSASTTGYANGSTIPYTITGIQAGDISQGLTGTMSVTNNVATKIITAVSDQTTEGSQTMTFSINGTNLSQDVTINDTSTKQVTWTSMTASGASLTFVLDPSEGTGPRSTLNALCNNVSQGFLLQFYSGPLGNEGSIAAQARITSAGTYTMVSYITNGNSRISMSPSTNTWSSLIGQSGFTASSAKVWDRLGQNVLRQTNF